MLHLIETLKDMTLVGITDTYSRISHPDFHPIGPVFRHLHRDRHTASLRRKLEGIGQQIHHDLAHLVGIESHIQAFQGRGECQADVFLLGQHQERIANVVYERNEIALGERQVQTRHLVLAEIQ